MNTLYKWTFKLIANALNDATSFLDPESRLLIAQTMAKHLKPTNPHFKEEYFIQVATENRE